MKKSIMALQFIYPYDEYFHRHNVNAHVKIFYLCMWIHLYILFICICCTKQIYCAQRTERYSAKTGRPPGETGQLEPELCYRSTTQLREFKTAVLREIKKIYINVQQTKYYYSLSFHSFLYTHIIHLYYKHNQTIYCPHWTECNVIINNILHYQVLGSLFHIATLINCHTMMRRMWKKGKGKLFQIIKRQININHSVFTYFITDIYVSVFSIYTHIHKKLMFNMQWFCDMCNV